MIASRRPVSDFKDSTETLYKAASEAPPGTQRLGRPESYSRSRPRRYPLSRVTGTCKQFVIGEGGVVQESNFIGSWVEPVP
jgi:hypothetical protein